MQEWRRRYRVTRTGLAVIADVVGKGADAAALTALVRRTLRAIAGEPSPAALLARLNAAIVSQRRRCTTFCTAALARIGPAPERNGRRLHPLPVLVRRHCPAAAVEKSGSLLGPVEEIQVAGRSVELWPGDALVLYTDGVTDARGGGGLVGQQRLPSLLDATRGFTPAAIVASARAALTRHAPGPPSDDVALLAVGVAL